MILLKTISSISILSSRSRFRIRVNRLIMCYYSRSSRSRMKRSESNSSRRRSGSNRSLVMSLKI